MWNLHMMVLIKETLTMKFQAYKYFCIMLGISMPTLNVKFKLLYMKDLT